jgi:hypothetical protein
MRQGMAARRGSSGVNRAGAAERDGLRGRPEKRPEAFGKNDVRGYSENEEAGGDKLKNRENPPADAQFAPNCGGRIAVGYDRCGATRILSRRRNKAQDVRFFLPILN